jgi:two-component system, cell cycle response regulator DivK
MTGLERRQSCTQAERARIVITPSNPKASNRLDAKEPPKPLILLVEDQVESREMYAEYLSYAGFSVVTAINGHEAVSLARMLHPDLILMDIAMPGMDGLEATADLKADPSFAQTPIVAITADSSYDICARARDAGCATLIAKPIFPDELVRRIRLMLTGVSSPADTDDSGS